MSTAVNPLEICPGCGRVCKELRVGQRFCKGCGVFPNQYICIDRMEAEIAFQRADLEARLVVARGALADLMAGIKPTTHGEGIGCA